MPVPTIRHLFPGYFAFVMATGIVAIAADEHGLGIVARALLAVALVAYSALSLLTVLRLVRYPRAVVADLANPATSFTFLTQVAATNVAGSAAGLILGWWTLAEVLWVVSLPLWVGWTYAALIGEITGGDRSAPSAARSVDGTWFMLTVATASVAVLGALVLGHWHHPFIAFTGAAAFCVGLVLYVIVMTMEFMRWALGNVTPGQLHPPEWIAMGAMAITTLAGANLLAAAPRHQLLIDLEPFLRGATVLAWGTATFWLPLVVGLGVWRYVVHRESWTYSPAYWSMVFPLGMYAVATDRFLVQITVPQLQWVPEAMLGVALVAWLATFAGLVRSIGQIGMRYPKNS